MWDYMKMLWRVTHFALGSQTARWKYLIMRVILHVCSSHGENVTPRITSWTWRASRWKQFVRWKCSFCTMHNLHSSTHRQQLLFNQLYIEWRPSQRQQERRRDISNKRRSHTHQVDLYHRRLRGSTQYFAFFNFVTIQKGTKTDVSSLMADTTCVFKMADLLNMLPSRRHVMLFIYFPLPFIVLYLFLCM